MAYKSSWPEKLKPQQWQCQIRTARPSGNSLTYSLKGIQQHLFWEAFSVFPWHGGYH